MNKSSDIDIEQLQFDLAMKTKQITKLEKCVRDYEMKLRSLDQRLNRLEVRRFPKR